jgi:endonuclease YncB( thermonuclease family)
LRFNSASIVIASFMLAISFLGYAAEISGKVVGIKDGDSFVLLDDDRIQHQVRLAGIDAPERSQSYGHVAKRSLSNMIFGKTIQVVWQTRDSYKRMVGKVLLQGEDINLRQIESGYAWHYRQYQHEQNLTDRQVYTDAEISARRSRQGLWQEPEPIPPWRYRRIQRNRTIGD